MNSNELHLQVEVYLGLRQALGYQRSPWEAKLLRQLVAFIDGQKAAGPLPSRLVLDWLDTNFPNSSPPQNARRLDVVRQFLIHLSSVIPDTAIPEFRLFARYLRPKPFLFSADEIEALLRAATACWPEGSLLPITLKTALGLLTSTGLRAGEALA